MSFRYPWLLLLLLAVPVLVYLRHARRHGAAVRFSDAAALAGLPRTWAVALQPLLPLLYGLGLAALAVALARPQIGIG